MFRSLLAVAFLLPAAASAGGYADWTEVEQVVWPDPDWYYYLAQGHHVFDLLTVTDDGDRWEVAHALAYFEGDPACDYTFWDHPLGGDLPPNPALFAAYWLLQYDSFWTCPEDWPNTDTGGIDTSFAPGSPLQNTDLVREAEWYADPEAPNADGGTYSLARYNVMGHPPEGCLEEETPAGVACELVIEGESFYESTGSLPWSFELRIPICWYIPEPGTLALFGLGLALTRRR